MEYIIINSKDTFWNRISDECKSEMTKNVCFLNKILDDGRIIYGVNTGYGGRFLFNILNWFIYDIIYYKLCNHIFIVAYIYINNILLSFITIHNI